MAIEDADTTVVGEVEGRKIITFRIAGRMFGIDMAAVSEIREWEEPTPLPGVADFIKGVINLRGSVIPVVGLAERLGWPASIPEARSCTIVVAIDGKQMGMLVDDVSDIVTVLDSSVQPTPEFDGGQGTFIGGVTTIEQAPIAGVEQTDGGGTMVLLLKLETLSLTRKAIDL